MEVQEAFGQHFTTSRQGCQIKLVNSGLRNYYSNRSRHAAHNYKPFSETCGLRQEILLARKGNKGRCRRIQPLLAPHPRRPLESGSILPRLKMLFLARTICFYTYFSSVLAMPGHFNSRFSFEPTSIVNPETQVSS